MKLKTIIKEDEIQITLTTSELVWLQVLLSCIRHKDSISGWMEEMRKFENALSEVKREGCRMRETSPQFEESELRFLKNDL